MMGTYGTIIEFSFYMLAILLETKRERQWNRTRSNQATRSQRLEIRSSSEPSCLIINKLPAEIRLMIYEHICPPDMLVCTVAYARRCKYEFPHFDNGTINEDHEKRD